MSSCSNSSCAWLARVAAVPLLLASPGQQCPLQSPAPLLPKASPGCGCLSWCLSAQFSPLHGKLWLNSPLFPRKSL